MKTISQTISTQALINKYPLLKERIDLHKQYFHTRSNQRIYYIDIETTGFNRSTDQVYLLGLLSIKTDDSVELIQYLCEKDSDEYTLLYTFNQLLDSDTLLIHFNGNSFDLPFLKARMVLFGIAELLSYTTSFDYYPSLRLFRKLLRTDNFKLKSMEKIVSFQREDTLTGSDLIPIYKAFREGDSTLQSLFLNHNMDDLIGLFYLNGFNTLFDLLSPDDPVQALLRRTQLEWKLSDGTLSDITLNSAFFESNPILEEKSNAKDIGNRQLNSGQSYPLQATHDNYTISTLHNRYQIQLPIAEGTYKYFYDNYKAYYYLVEEDYAIHKLVADFVNSKYKRKATKETAYIKKEGTFIRCPLFDATQFEILKSFNLPIFRESHTSKNCYIEINDFIKNATLIIPWIVSKIFIQ